MSIRSQIPNLFTLGNLLCGAVSIVLWRGGVTEVEGWVIAGLVALALVLDFLDGFVARLLGVSSPLGGELDSLADLVTFGLLPGLLSLEAMEILSAGVERPWNWAPWVALMLPLFAAYRLAKFNVDTEQRYGFKGLPTPANAIFFLSMYLWVRVDTGWLPVEAFDHGLGLPQWPLYAGLALIIGFSMLMVSNLPLMAFKLKTYGWRENAHKYLFLMASAVLAILFFYRGIPAIIGLYFIASVVDARLRASKN